MDQVLTEQEIVRRNKMEELRNKGIDPFGSRYERTATSGEIREALKVANENKDELIKKLYKSFDGNNGLLKRAKTCNSTFGFLSTIVFVPGLIMWLTDFCEKMTEKRKAQEKALAEGKANEVDANSNAKVDASQKMDVKPVSASSIPTNAPTMAGFLKK